MSNFRLYLLKIYFKFRLTCVTVDQAVQVVPTAPLRVIKARLVQAWFIHKLWTKGTFDYDHDLI